MTDRQRRRQSNRLREKPSPSIKTMYAIVFLVLIVPNAIYLLTL